MVQALSAVQNSSRVSQLVPTDILDRLPDWLADDIRQALASGSTSTSSNKTEIDPAKAEKADVSQVVDLSIRIQIQSVSAAIPGDAPSTESSSPVAALRHFRRAMKDSLRDLISHLGNLTDEQKAKVRSLFRDFAKELRTALKQLRHRDSEDGSESTNPQAAFDAVKKAVDNLVNGLSDIFPAPSTTTTEDKTTATSTDPLAEFKKAAADLLDQLAQQLGISLKTDSEAASKTDAAAEPAAESASVQPNLNSGGSWTSFQYTSISIDFRLRAFSRQETADQLPAVSQVNAAA